MNQEIKICQNCKGPFTIEPEDFNFYEKIQVPPPEINQKMEFIKTPLNISMGSGNVPTNLKLRTRRSEKKSSTVNHAITPR